MLPREIIKNIITKPTTRSEDTAIREMKELTSMGYHDKALKSMIISQEDAILSLEKMNILKKQHFMSTI